MTKASLSLLACFAIYGAAIEACGSSSSGVTGDTTSTPTSSSSGGSSGGTNFGSSGGSSGVGSSSGSGGGVGSGDDAGGDDAGDAAGDDAGDATMNDAAPAGDGGAPCGPPTCVGCCDSTGTCAPGGATTACGSNGMTCSNCGSGTCGAGVCIGGGPPADSGSSSQCTGVTCFAPDDCVYLQAFITVSGGRNCNFTMCSYASGRGICQ